MSFFYPYNTKGKINEEFVKKSHTRACSPLYSGIYPPPPAFANADEVLYLGGDIGLATAYEFCDDGRQIFSGASNFVASTFTCSDNSPFFRLHGGVQVNELLALELGGALLTKPFEVGGRFGSDFVKIEVDYHSFDISALGTFPINDTLTVYGRVGAAAWESDATLTEGSTTIDASDDGTDFLYGVGAKAEMSENFHLNVYWTRVGGDAEVDSFAIGGSYRF